MIKNHSIRQTAVSRVGKEGGSRPFRATPTERLREYEKRAGEAKKHLAKVRVIDQAKLDKPVTL